jgi:hypothetical protein
MQSMVLCLEWQFARSFNAGKTAFPFSGPNFKSFQTLLQRNFVDDKAVDVASEMAIENGLQKFVHLMLFALNQKFNPAIDEVFHRSNYLVSRRNRFDGEAKANTLDSSLVKNSFRDHAPPLAEPRSYQAW